MLFMDSLLDLAGSFASLVGLLANFKAERKGTDLPEFIEWLKAQHQEELARSISAHKEVEQALSKLLATNHEELVGRLKGITDQLAQIASGVEGFEQLVRLTHRGSTLSWQAVSILRQMSQSPAKFVMEHKTLGGTEFLLMDGASGRIKADESRFLMEDFEALVDAGLLRVEFASKGSRRFYVTRAGAEAAGGR